jgi:hypothetical protein
LKTRDLHGNVKRSLDDFFLFKDFLSFLKNHVPSGVSFTNKYLVNVDGHGNHVVLEAISQAQEMGLNMITLPSHTSYALQPLDVFCFKPSKQHLERLKDVAISRNNHMEPHKITLVGCVDQALKQSLTLKLKKIWI